MRLSRTFATFIPSTYLSNIVSGCCSEIQLPLYAWHVLYCTFHLFGLCTQMYLLIFYFRRVSSLMSWLIICAAYVSLRMRLPMILRWCFIHKHTLPSVVLACWSTHPVFEHSNNNLTSILAQCYSVSWYEQHGAYLLSCLFVSSVANLFAEESDLGWCYSPVSTWDLSHALVTIYMPKQTKKERKKRKGKKVSAFTHCWYIKHWP